MELDIELDQYESAVVKCLEDNLNNYLNKEFSYRLTERVRDYFILDRIHLYLAQQRVKNQVNRMDKEKNKDNE